MVFVPKDEHSKSYTKKKQSQEEVNHGINIKIKDYHNGTAKQYTHYDKIYVESNWHVKMGHYLQPHPL